MINLKNKFNFNKPNIAIHDIFLRLLQSWALQLTSFGRDLAIKKFKSALLNWLCRWLTEQLFSSGIALTMNWRILWTCRNLDKSIFINLNLPIITKQLRWAICTIKNKGQQEIFNLDQPFPILYTDSDYPIILHISPFAWSLFLPSLCPFILSLNTHRWKWKKKSKKTPSLLT